MLGQTEPKSGGRAVVPLSVGSWVPIERNVTWVEAYLRIKWYPGAFSRLATIHMGRKVGGGAVHLSGGSWVSVLDNVAWAEAYLRRTKWHLDPSSHGHNRHRPNSGGLLCPLFGVGLLLCEGAGSPSKTMWHRPRRTSIPSGILIHPTVWPQYTNVTDR